MAEGKKSFILYSNIRNTVVKLPVEKQAQLFMMILDYVNDLDPKTDDLLLEVAFEPIKQQLKSDLKKWDSLREKRSEAGRIGGKKSGEARSSNVKQPEANEAFASTSKQIEANEAVNVNAIVNVIDNVLLEKEPKEKKIKKKKLIDFSVDLETRRKNFRESLIEFENEFGSELIEKFFLYWGEKTVSGKEMRFEIQKTWELNLRLIRWKNNNLGNNGKQPTKAQQRDQAMRDYINR